MLRAMFCAAAFAVPLSAAAFTGADLDRLCAKTDVKSRASCAAYIEGAADGVYNTIDAIGGTTGPRVGQYFCLPPDIRAQQMTDAVRKYIAENPKLADYNASTAVSLGLGKAFPCRAAADRCRVRAHAPPGQRRRIQHEASRLITEASGRR